jgi:hypothetical protein
LNLRHSGENTFEYGDTTGLMGYSTTQLGVPLSCFNGHKNYYLGWYSDRTAILDGSKSWGGRLFAFVDYNKTPNDGHVLIKVGNLFIQWNRAKSFNNETRAHRDEVTIVHNPDSNTGSFMAGTVSPNATKVYRYTNYESSGFDLVIEACEASFGPPEFLKMSIHLADGIQLWCGFDVDLRVCKLYNAIQLSLDISHKISYHTTYFLANILKEANCETQSSSTHSSPCGVPPVILSDWVGLLRRFTQSHFFFARKGTHVHMVASLSGLAGETLCSTSKSSSACCVS